jgi:hypothetical protein
MADVLRQAVPKHYLHPDGERFATGWWRRERNFKLTFSRYASVVQRAQAYWMRFSVHTGNYSDENQSRRPLVARASKTMIAGRVQR